MTGFEFVNLTRRRIHLSELARRVEKIPTFLRRRSRLLGRVELSKNFSFYFVSRARMIKLNAQFRQKKRATDVLTFPGDFHEIFLCATIVSLQAKQNRHSFLDESLYLCLHGILHAMGYDHEVSPADAKVMLNLQDAIFERIRR